jgi:hypothetical protein
VEVTPGGLLCASTPGWTTRAWSGARPAYGVYPESDSLTAALHAGRSSGTRRGYPIQRGRAGVTRVEPVAPLGSGQWRTQHAARRLGPHRVRGSCHRLCRPRFRWWPTGGRDQAAADELPTTQETPFRMLRAMLAPSRLPVRPRGCFHRLAPLARGCRPTPPAWWGRRARKNEPPGFSGPAHAGDRAERTRRGARFWDPFARRQTPPQTTGSAGHRPLLTRHPACVRHGPTSDVPCQIDEHAFSMRIPLAAVSVPLLTPKLVASPLAVALGQASRQDELPLANGRVNGCQQLAAVERHDHP